MQTLDDKPETIHLYVVREEDPKPPVLPIVLSALSLAVLLVFCVLTPYQQPVSRAVIRVPAVLLPIRAFNVAVAIIPTGVKTYPATVARGILTITNGSIIGQSIPAGFTVNGVATDYAIYVPSGNANGYGWAQVSAHAGIPGKKGNIPAYAINSVIGSSVYVRNLSPFTSGRDAYSVKFITSNDRNVATSKARDLLTSKIVGLHFPCGEVASVNKSVVSVRWNCRMYTYIVPSYMHVLGTQLQGKNLLVTVWFIAPNRRTWAK